MKKTRAKKNSKFKLEYLIYIFCGISVLFVGYKLFLKRISAIEGELSYPAEATPMQKICAIEVETKVETCVDENILDDKFQIPIAYRLEVKPGRYYVYTTISSKENPSNWGDMPGYKGFYTDYSKNGCGFGGADQQKCDEISKNNRPVIVDIILGETISNISFDWNKGDFYDEIVLGKKIDTIVPTNIPTNTPTLTQIIKPTVIPTTKPTPVPSKEITKVQILISSTYYYCFEDKANSISNKQNEVTRLKNELAVCEFNDSQEKYKCNNECEHQVKLCQGNCYTTFTPQSPDNYLFDCFDGCLTNKPACSCPSATGCQGISSNLSKSQNELISMIKSYCP